MRLINFLLLFIFFQNVSSQNFDLNNLDFYEYLRNKQLLNFKKNDFSHTIRPINSNFLNEIKNVITNNNQNNNNRNNTGKCNNMNLNKLYKKYGTLGFNDNL